MRSVSRGRFEKEIKGQSDAEVRVMSGWNLWVAPSGLSTSRDHNFCIIRSFFFGKMNFSQLLPRGERIVFNQLTSGRKTKWKKDPGRRSEERRLGGTNYKTSILIENLTNWGFIFAREWYELYLPNRCYLEGIGQMISDCYSRSIQH